MEVKNIAEIVKKYKMEDLFMSNSYLLFGERAVWKYKDKWSDENLFKMKDEEDNMFFSISLSLLSEVTLDIDKKNQIKKMYREIALWDWNELKEKYFNQENFSWDNKDFQKHFKTLMDEKTFQILPHREIKFIVENVKSEIKKNGITNQSYSILFNILEAYEKLSDKSMIVNYQLKYDYIKETIFTIIQENPDFYHSNERKFYTYKKFHCDVLGFKMNKELIDELNVVMNFQPKEEYYLFEINNSEILVKPNIEYNFLDKFDERYRDFKKQVYFLSYVLKTAIKENDFKEVITKVEVTKKEVENGFYKSNMLLIESQYPNVIEKLINKILMLMFENTEFKKLYNMSYASEKNILYEDEIKEYIIPDLLKEARSLILKDKLQNINKVDKIESKKMKI